MSHDSFFPAPPPLAFADGFVIEEGAPGLPGAGPARGARLPCGHVRGFDAALDAALDPRTAPPARLVLVTPEEDTSTWLERWAEDADQVRRALVIRRARDGAEVVIIATLASHGYGVPTSLAIESVRAREETDILRSGVHRKVDVEAALARRAAEVDAHPPT